jgi:hypothetical protein
MELFRQLGRRRASPWDSFLRGASTMTLYPIHAPSFAVGFSSDEEASGKDWEAVGIDLWKSILGLTPEQPCERSACEYPR